MTDPFFEKFRHFFPLEKEKWEEYIGHYRRIEVPSRTILLHEGEISKKAYFIEKGCIRAWFSSKKRDITYQFFFEDIAVSSAESFRKSVPSMFTIETIEPCILHWISKENMDKIMYETMQRQDTRDQLVDAMFERQMNYANHFLSFIKYTPRERYMQLVKERPEIILRVPQQYIASYLGITPVSLSRIRSRLKE